MKCSVLFICSASMFPRKNLWWLIRFNSNYSIDVPWKGLSSGLVDGFIRWVNPQAPYSLEQFPNSTGSWPWNFIKRSSWTPLKTPVSEFQNLCFKVWSEEICWNKVLERNTDACHKWTSESFVRLKTTLDIYLVEYMGGPPTSPSTATYTT